MGSTLNGTELSIKRNDPPRPLSYDPIISSKRDLTSRGVAPFNEKLPQVPNPGSYEIPPWVLLIYREDAVALLYIPPQVFKKALLNRVSKHRRGGGSLF
jgi:hypothetical protein